MDPYKIVTIGSLGVGKTSLIIRALYNQFLTDADEVNNYIEGKVKEGGGVALNVNMTYQGNNLPLRFHDTLGQERFTVLTSSYFRLANAIIVVYDVSNQDSFDILMDQITEAKTFIYNPFTVFLVANKSDLNEPERVISSEQGHHFASDQKYQFFETSAKDGTAVDVLLQAVLKDAYSRLYAGQPAPSPGTSSTSTGGGEAAHSSAHKSGSKPNKSGSGGGKCLIL
eukprot:TRINITY_DN10278_c0_g1_i1.p1 TRINITY_DN10278_c0_g1~~TRINITY_DN10278_c0_g1_i1.p1  ORF type:complete len:226 (-),score=47.68 TRINITY_DN10278_c0_g1_i1:2-679(-)